MGCAGDGLWGDSADMFNEAVFVEAFAVGGDDLGDAFENAGRQGHLFAFPGAQGDTERAV